MQLVVVMIVTNMPQGASLWREDVLKLLESTKKFSSLAVKKGASDLWIKIRKIFFFYIFDTDCLLVWYFWAMWGGKLEVVIWQWSSPCCKYKCHLFKHRYKYKWFTLKYKLKIKYKYKCSCHFFKVYQVLMVGERRLWH